MSGEAADAGGRFFFWSDTHLIQSHYLGDDHEQCHAKCRYCRSVVGIVK
jgi:hypothetical protein